MLASSRASRRPLKRANPRANTTACSDQSPLLIEKAAVLSQAARLAIFYSTASAASAGQGQRRSSFRRHGPFSAQRLAGIIFGCLIESRVELLMTRRSCLQNVAGSICADRAGPLFRRWRNQADMSRQLTAGQSANGAFCLRFSQTSNQRQASARRAAEAGEHLRTKLGLNCTCSMPAQDDEPVQSPDQGRCALKICLASQGRIAKRSLKSAAKWMPPAKRYTASDCASWIQKNLHRSRPCNGAAPWLPATAEDVGLGWQRLNYRLLFGLDSVPGCGSGTPFE